MAIIKTDRETRLISQVLEKLSEMISMKHRFFSPGGSPARQKLGEMARRLIREESGQSMTEYILILFLVVLIFNQMKKGLLPKIQSLVGKIGSDLGEATDGGVN
jgi:hypothetical protein